MALCSARLSCEKREREGSREGEIRKDDVRESGKRERLRNTAERKRRQSLSEEKDPLLLKKK